MRWMGSRASRSVLSAGNEAQVSAGIAMVACRADWSSAGQLPPSRERVVRAGRLGPMGPTRRDMVSAATLVLVLVAVMAALVFFAIPPGGAPTLQ